MTSASLCAARLSGLAGTLCVLLAAAPAGAQGVSAGAASGDGYKLPGGFEPILHLRSFYYDQESLTGTPSSAWAIGGWAGARSPWWGDRVQVGIVGYTSQKLDGPLDEDGSKLLGPGQTPINVLGEAYVAMRLFGHTATAYRQLINRPFINPHDVRMVPVTFEAYTLSGTAQQLAYTGGYITKKKNRESERFVWMSVIAGGKGSHKGVAYAGATWNFAKNGYVRIDEQYAVDVFNTFHVDARVPVAIDQQTALTLGAQYFPQTGVGARQIGAFSTHGAGVQASITRGPLGVQLSGTQTGRGQDSQAPFGSHASYLSSQMLDFNSAGEKAWGLRATLDFTSLGAPGLTALAQYGTGSHRIDANTGQALPDRSETALRADYTFGKGSALTGLIATLRYAWVHQDGSPQDQRNLRLIVNYPLALR